mmetsp:Transcript_35816/g.100758  ORF Transcript_35816/g.100758 Transcript_35816/m.100758 type:complete len:281 (+) Transcript_35816:285-1127(+)
MQHMPAGQVCPGPEQRVQPLLDGEVRVRRKQLLRRLPRREQRPRERRPVRRRPVRAHVRRGRPAHTRVEGQLVRVDLGGRVCEPGAPEPLLAGLHARGDVPAAVCQCRQHRGQALRDPRRAVRPGRRREQRGLQGHGRERQQGQQLRGHRGGPHDLQELQGAVRRPRQLHGGRVQAVLGRHDPVRGVGRTHQRDGVRAGPHEPPRFPLPPLHPRPLGASVRIVALGAALRGGGVSGAGVGGAVSARRTCAITCPLSSSCPAGGPASSDATMVYQIAGEVF